jgi:hypothetical protein
MNVYVDSQVNKRNCDIQQGRRQRPETILCNSFPSFFEFKYEGKSILQSPAKFVREVAGILTMNHIGDAKARPEREAGRLGCKSGFILQHGKLMLSLRRWMIVWISQCSV